MFSRLLSPTLNLATRRLIERSIRTTVYGMTPVKTPCPEGCTKSSFGGSARQTTCPTCKGRGYIETTTVSNFSGRVFYMNDPRVQLAFAQYGIQGGELGDLAISFPVRLEKDVRAFLNISGKWFLVDGRRAKHMTDLVDTLDGETSYIVFCTYESAGSE